MTGTMLRFFGVNRWLTWTSGVQKKSLGVTSGRP